jgi:hypothetical protein
MERFDPCEVRRCLSGVLWFKTQRPSARMRHQGHFGVRRLQLIRSELHGVAGTTIRDCWSVDRAEFRSDCPSLATRRPHRRDQLVKRVKQRPSLGQSRQCSAAGLVPPDAGFRFVADGAVSANFCFFSQRRPEEEPRGDAGEPMPRLSLRDR